MSSYDTRKGDNRKRQTLNSHKPLSPLDKNIKSLPKKQKLLDDPYYETVVVDSQKQKNKLIDTKLSKKDQQVAAIRLGLFNNLKKNNNSITTNNTSEIQNNNINNTDNLSDEELNEIIDIKSDKQYESEPDLTANDICVNNTTVSSIKHKQNVLGKGYRSQIHSYARDQLFKRVKILEKSHLEIDGDIIKSCLAKIDSKSILANKQLVLNSVRTEVTNTINARRGYVKKRVIESLKDILQTEMEDEMFDSNMMHHFYDSSYSKDSKVLHAWYIYVYRFLPLCNKQWKENLSSGQIQNEHFMFSSISESDEAVIQWLIILVLPNLISQKKEGWPVMEKSPSHGPQISKYARNLYSKLHFNIEKTRENFKNVVAWNDLFWSELKKRHPLFFNNTNDSSNSKTKQYDYGIPLPGLNKEKDYLAMYNAIKIKSDLGADDQEEENEGSHRDCSKTMEVKSGYINITGI